MNIILYIPHILAVLNTVSAVLITVGYIKIRRNNKFAHRAFMLTALLVSALFMVFYLYYHSKVGYIPFAGKGSVRYLYFPLLASHVILAAIVLPVVLVTAGLALKEKYITHKRIAHWAFPAWLYVSLSGVTIYVMSFHIYTNSQ